MTDRAGDVHMKVKTRVKAGIMHAQVIDFTYLD